MNSDSTIFSQNSDSVKSLRLRAKSFSLGTRSSDSIDNSKRFQDSDTLKLSSSLDSEEVTKNMKREEHCRSQTGSQTDRHPQLLTQFYLTSMKMKPKWGC